LRLCGNNKILPFTASSQYDFKLFFVVEPFIETMELRHVQGTHKQKQSGRYYLRADGPYEGEPEYFKPD
jgi:hypothetical protein